MTGKSSYDRPMVALDTRPSASPHRSASLGRLAGLWLISGWVWMGCAVPETPQAPAVAPPPPTQQDNVVDVLHGVEIVDPYRWLEDQDAPETRAWLDAQNAYTFDHLADRPERPVLERRIRELVSIDRIAAPIVRGGRFFVWKKKATDDLWVLHLREGLDGEDRVLLDPHALSDDHTVSIDLADVSPDGSWLVYEIRRGGADETELRLFDVDRRQDLPDRFPVALYSGVAIAPDTGSDRSFFYGRQDGRDGFHIFRHRLGNTAESDTAESDTAESDQKLFGDGYGPGPWMSPMLSEDGRYLVVTVSHGWTSTELHLLDLDADGPFRTLVDARTLGGVEATFRPHFAGNRLFAHTHWRAPNGRLVEVDLTGETLPADWPEVIREGEDALQAVSFVGGQVFARTLHNVVTRLERYSLDGDFLGEVPLPGPGAAGTPRGPWTGRSAFFGFQSFTTPPTLHRYDTVDDTAEVWARDAVPFQGAELVTRQEWFTSRDGTRVPMFIVHRANLPLDGNLPTLLYGYGGFNVSLTPRFSTLPALWLEYGGVYALANIRGGGEFGEAWHRAGMLENKQNVFDDFIAAAEHLVDSGITHPGRLAIQGGSNGGLLMGAVLTQRPDLFRAVLCQFPDLDMVRYHQFEHHNPPALLEYGDASIREHFEFLRAYSPYQNVRDGIDYPAVLLTSGDNDTRVPPLQARKMAARLQHASASGLPVFLLYDTDAGHAGGRPQSKTIEDLALKATFLFSQLGVDVR